MIYAYIGSIIVIILLVAVSVMAVRWVSDSVGRSIKHRTLELISSYDELLDKKSAELAESAPTPVSAAPVRSAAVRQEPRNVQSNPADMLSALTGVSYRDSTVGATYRKIRDGFRFSPEEAMEQLNSDAPEQDSGRAGLLLEQLDFDTCFKLSTLAPEEQYSVLSSALEDCGADLLEEYRQENNRFSIIEFYGWLKQLESSETGKIRMHVSPGSVFDSIPEGVELVEDSTICEGFQLETGSRVYDYSIKMREIS